MNISSTALAEGELSNLSMRRLTHFNIRLFLQILLEKADWAESVK